MSDTEAPPQERPKPTKPTPTINHPFVSIHGPERESFYWGWDQREMQDLWGTKNPEEKCWACDATLKEHWEIDDAKAAGVEMVDPPEIKTDFDVYAKNNTLFQMNHFGFCGQVLYSGKRCTNRVVAWFGDAEDPGGRMGACGTHAESVEREFKASGFSRQDVQIRRFIEHEEKRVINILCNAGLKAKKAGYAGKGVIIENWGVLLAWLDGKGFDFDERNWQEVAEERRLAELAKICKTCHKEHEITPDEDWPQCDQFQPHRFFPRINNKDLCAICGGPDSFAMHDKALIPRVEGL